MKIKIPKLSFFVCVCVNVLCPFVLFDREVAVIQEGFVHSEL